MPSKSTHGIILTHEGGRGLTAQLASGGLCFFVPSVSGPAHDAARAWLVEQGAKTVEFLDEKYVRTEEVL